MAADRFKRLLIMNTALAVGHSPGQGFEDWRSFSNAHPDMDIARLMARAVPILSREQRHMPPPSPTFLIRQACDAFRKW